MNVALTRKLASPSRRGPVSGRERGFTLVELMVTLTVFAILLALAIPAFNNAALNGKLNSFANALVASAYLARGEAIKRNAPVRLCVANGDACGAGGWEQGWIVVTNAGEVLQRQAALQAGYEVTGDQDVIVFQPSGVGATAANFTICRSGPEVGTQERVLTIGATGRPSVKRTEAGSCS